MGAIYTYDEIDSEALPTTERFALWRETGRLPMATEAIGDDGRRQFRIRVRRVSGPSGRFIDLTATPMKLIREKRHYACDRLDMLSLTMMLAPDVQHQFGRAAPSGLVRPGQILVKDFTQPATAWWRRRSSRSLNLHLPRITVEAAVGDKIRRLHGTVLSSAGLTPMLEAQLLTLGNITSRLQRAERAAALDATIELALSVLRCELGAQREDESNSAGLFAAAQVFIKRHLTSRRLSPALIARQLGCSRAHLYRVFSSRDESVAHYVRELRLRRGRDLLSRDTEAHTRIADVAYRCGFDDPVHFARLFRQRFGLTPSTFKAANRGPACKLDFSAPHSAI